MKKLIVNADDFGLTEGVNRAILDGHKRGIITNASLLANGGAFDAAVVASRDVEALGVGVHLNLTDGPPIADPSLVSSLLCSGGVFTGSPFAVARRVMRREMKLDEVEREWRSQIEKIVSAGIRISHLDGHKHIHLLPPLFDAAIKLAREFKIGCIRITLEPVTAGLGLFRPGAARGPGAAKQFVLGRVLSGLAAWQKKKLVAAGLHWPKHFYGLSQTGFLDAHTLNRILRSLPEGSSEMICHPGYVDRALLATRTRLRSQRETELAALTQPGLKALIAELGIELIAYGNLAAARSGAEEFIKRKEESPSVQEAARKA